MLGGCGSTKILNKIEEHLGIHAGQTTKDKLFTVIEVECLGACANAPMVQINEDYYEDLTPESIVKVLDGLKEGEQVKPGPQDGRLQSAPATPDRPLQSKVRALLLQALTPQPYGPGQYCVPEFQ